jgi:hypothetical protein
VFGHAKTSLPDSRHHFGVNEETARFGYELSEHFPAKHFQGTIHIANLSPKQCSSEPIITPGEKPSSPGVLSIDPVASDNGIIVGKTGKKAEIAQIELAIGIGEGNEFESGRFKTSSKCGSISFVDVVSNEPGMSRQR